MKRLLPGLAAFAVGALLTVPIPASAEYCEECSAHVINSHEAEANGFHWGFYLDEDEDGEVTATITDVWQVDANGEWKPWDATTLTVPATLTATLESGTDYATFERVFDADGNFLSNKWTKVDSSRTKETVTAPVTTFDVELSIGTLTSITFPDSLEYISSEELYCTNLTSVTMGDDVRFNRDTFESTPWFETLKDGDFYVHGEKLLAYAGDAAEVTVPDGITTICLSAFDRDYNSNVTNLTSVTLPEGVESIETYAFYGCSKLEAINIPEGVTSMGNDVFSYCDSLTNVQLPTSLIRMGSTFEDCYALTKVNVPEGVKSIYGTFRDCTNLTEATLPTTLKYLGYETFYNCSALKKVNIPEGITAIDSYAFHNCESLATVTLPSTLGYVGYGAFEDSGLKSVTIPEGVYGIGSYAFAGCENLATVTLPSTMEYISDYAFAWTAISSVALPEELEYLYYYAFGNCENLKTVTGSGANLRWVDGGAFHGSPVYEEVESGLVRVGPIVFGYRGDAVASLTIPEGVSYIMPHAFYEYGVGYGHYEEVYNEENQWWEYVWVEGDSTPCTLSLPASLKRIGAYAFAFSSVEKVTGGANVEAVDGAAFYDTPYEYSLYDYMDDPEKPFEFLRLGGVVVGWNGVLPATLAIPDDVLGLNVNFGDWNSSSNVTAVTIGSGIARIPDSAFQGMPNLVTVTGGEGLDAIGESAFEDCGKLESVELNGVIDELEEDIFWDCGSLKTVALAGPEIDFDDGTFYNCTNLVSVTVTLTEPDDEDEEPYVEINSGTFFDCYSRQDCSKLESVTVIRHGYKLIGWEGEGDEFDTDISTFKLYSEYDTDCCYWDHQKQDAICEACKGHDEIYFYPMWQKVLRNVEEDGEFSNAANTVYQGWLTNDDGDMVGSIMIKVTKARAGASKATATVVVAGAKKTTVKGSVGADGTGAEGLAGLTFGADGLSGTLVFGGATYAVDGARDVNKTKGDADQAILNALRGKVWTVVLEPEGKSKLPADANGFIALSVTMGAKGKAKISGTLPTGVKVTANGQTIVGVDTCCIPVVYSKKDSLSFLLWVDHSGNAIEVSNLGPWKSAGFTAELDDSEFELLTPITGTTTFSVVEDEMPTVAGMLSGFLPVGEPVVTGARWSVNKPAVIKFKNGVFDQASYDKGVAAGKTNVASLKLNYTAKTGLFKGSFKVYALQGGKLKKLNAKLNGVVCDGVGFGTANIKNVGSVPVFVGVWED